MMDKNRKVTLAGIRKGRKENKSGKAEKRASRNGAERHFRTGRAQTAQARIRNCYLRCNEVLREDLECKSRSVRQRDHPAAMFSLVRQISTA